MIVPRFAPFIVALTVAACSSSTTPTSSSDGTGEGSSSGGSSSGSSGGSGTGADSGAGSAPVGDAKLVVEIPASFRGTTRELDVVVTPTVPIAGPPAGTLYQVAKPVVTPGQPLTIHGDATGIKGSYYIVVVLYMQGGGQFSPAAGVDYETQTTAPVTFTGKALDLGALALALAGDGGT